MIQYLPIIKVLDFSDITIPKRVTVVRRDDGKLWWMYTNAIPEIKNDLNSIKILNNGIIDRFESYKFSQCLFNILLYNNLTLDRPQKFTFINDNGIATFTYFIDEDEIISIPILPQHNHSIKFTLYENYPVMKLRTNPKSQHV
jgi:hypothetical protein